MSRSSSFLFSADFFNTEEAIILETKCKAEGVIAYLKILCHLRRAEDHSITTDPVIGSKIISVSKKIYQKVLDVCLENNLFFQKENRIFSKNILEDLEKLEIKKENYSKAASKREATKTTLNADNIKLISKNDTKETEKNDSKILVESCQNLQDKDKEKEKVKDKESKGGLLRGEIENLEIPKQWDAEAVKKSLTTWVDYHEKDLKLPYKSITPIKALLTSLEKSRPSTELVVFAINYAMAHQWQGVSLYPSVVQAFEGSTKKLTPQEETQRVLAEWDAAAFELEHPELYANEGGAQ